MSSEQTYRVLLIEDEPALAQLMQKRLKASGFVVDVARNGETGLARSSARAYDAIIVDYSLPDRDGLSVIREMVVSGCQVPTMMVTGSGSEDVAVEAMRLGVRDYIVKDIVGGYLSFLPAAVRRAIAQHHLAQEKQRAEEELRRVKAITEKALDTLEDPFYVLDTGGRFLSWNKALRTVSGYSDEEIASMALADFFTAEDRSYVEDAFARVVAESCVQTEVNLLTKDGTRRCCELSGSLIRDAGGQPQAICGLARNISRRSSPSR